MHRTNNTGMTVFWTFLALDIDCWIINDKFNNKIFDTYKPPLTLILIRWVVCLVLLFFRTGAYSRIKTAKIKFSTLTFKNSCIPSLDILKIYHSSFNLIHQSTLSWVRLAWLANQYSSYPSLEPPEALLPTFYIFTCVETNLLLDILWSNTRQTCILSIS